ncbi:TetR family transcriptional regulator [Desulfoluna limicola]|uniref:TetR family transcriptional regulator n=1 Tax=Desulfoluna limicola TaxID=2810562 RepID=A0ABM7PMA8_9BACT|nr:TetR/AcrR family transcriptional regulator [Desulfoluna limicola]BCS98395.1 TetR family transcriptional regulator [Desulfoluna limicola]
MPETFPDISSCKSTRQAILDAAGQLFAHKGLGGTGIREIVKQAGTSLSSVNYHFTNKEGLYLACIRHIMDEKLDFPGLFSILDMGPYTTPQQVSDVLGYMMHRCLMALLGPGVPEWYGTLMVRSRMELHPKSSRALMRLEEPQKLRTFVLDHVPGLNEAFVQYWYVNVMAQVQYYILEREAVLIAFDITLYDEAFLNATACYMAESMTQILGLPVPDHGEVARRL